ncbi:MAG TPA: hypothetical protein VFY23_01390 [Candidatus Limnocylindrales bacterium]|nr:hypothetical protein [Candidatus Limnocylindrales bacterium]
MTDSAPLILALSLLGIGGGILLLVRGFAGYGSAARVGDTATSRIATLAAGEVRLTGVIEPAEVTITSPLQGRPCVWYRARVSSGRDEPDFAEERAIGFRLRDGSGTIRVFPRGARIDAPDRLDETDSLLGERPVGVTWPWAAPPGVTIPGDREAQIAALLTVRAAEPVDDGPADTRRRRYTEARLEPGDLVTVVGTALPFGHLADPHGSDRLDRQGDPLAGLDDPEVAASIAEAREAGILVSPEEAWGNAAIPGFGIGRPVRDPELDEGVARPVLATAEEAAAIERTWDLEPDLLVLAAAPDSPLLIAAGAPSEVVAREEGRFLLGLLGALLAIGSAVVGAITLTAL